MKQPENSIDICEETLSGCFDVWIDSSWAGIDAAAIATGKTRKSALKAAHRRLERLKRDVARELEGLENGD